MLIEQIEDKKNEVNRIVLDSELVVNDLNN
jgi:hypothetical protein